MRTVDFVSGLCASCPLPGGIAFEDYGAVEDVSAEGEVEVFAIVGFESERFHFWEFVDCCCDGRVWEVVDGI